MLRIQRRLVLAFLTLIFQINFDLFVLLERYGVAILVRDAQLAFDVGLQVDFVVEDRGLVEHFREQVVLFEVGGAPGDVVEEIFAHQANPLLGLKINHFVIKLDQ